jgi:hypothetical protein
LKAILKTIVILYTCIICLQSQAQENCSEIFNLSSPSPVEFNFHAFDGYARDAYTTAQKLNYPTTWKYRKMGGALEDIFPGEILAGSTANIYRAEKENGQHIILKQYEQLDDLARDLRAYEHLTSVLKSKSPDRFIVPKAIRSRRNPFVIEIEYFRGVDFKTFLEMNKGNRYLFTLIEKYNRSVSHLTAALSSETGDSEAKIDSTKLNTIISGSVDNYFIWLHPVNVLVVENRSHESGFDFVIIDPE